MRYLEMILSSLMMLLFFSGYSQTSLPTATFTVSKNVSPFTNFEFVCDASKSSDVDGIKTYEWIITGPDIKGNQKVSLNTPVYRQVFGCSNGTYTFRLIVYDNNGEISKSIYRKVKVKFTHLDGGQFDPEYKMKVSKAKFASSKRI